MDDAKDDGFTALHLAALNNHRAVAELLLESVSEGGGREEWIVGVGGDGREEWTVGVGGDGREEWTVGVGGDWGGAGEGRRETVGCDVRCEV